MLRTPVTNQGNFNKTEKMNKIISFENTMSVQEFAAKKKITSFKLQRYTNKEGVSNVGAVFTVGDETVWFPISATLKEIWTSVSGNDVRISTVTREDGTKHPFVHGVGGNELL